MSTTVININDYKSKNSIKDLSEYKDYDVDMHIEEMSYENASKVVKTIQDDISAKGVNRIW